jgi:UDP-glucuronate 4-epimerase
MLFADAILNDRAIKVFNHGNMSRDFTYVDGVIIDNSSQEFNPSISTAPYNIGNNTPVQL